MRFSSNKEVDQTQQCGCVRSQACGCEKKAYTRARVGLHDRGARGLRAPLVQRRARRGPVRVVGVAALAREVEHDARTRQLKERFFNSDQSENEYGAQATN